MSETLDISVVIPAYNEENFVGRAIDSVMMQSKQPREIIVVDDGSTDGTGDIIKKYKNVYYIKQENAGLAAARNTGIYASRSEYVAFLDSDDEWNCDYLEDCWNLLFANPEINWCCSAYDRRSVDGALSFTRSVHEKWINKGVIENYFLCEASEHFSLPTVMIVRKSVFNDIGAFNVDISQFGEDLDMWFRIALDNPKIIYLTKPGAQYWEREGSITNTSNVDVPRFLRRIQRTESTALSREISSRIQSEPVVVDWLHRAVRESIRQADKDSMRHINTYYGNRLSIKMRCLLIVARRIPYVLLRSLVSTRVRLTNDV